MVLGKLIDTYLFLWARLVVRARKPFIVGVTGSAGKTTTTAMIATVLKQEAARPIVGGVAHALHNMNNDRGVPLTVLRYDSWPENNIGLLRLCLFVPFRSLRLAMTGHYPNILVLEYGAGWRGHLAWLVQLAPPNVGVVTTIGRASETRQGAVH